MGATAAKSLSAKAKSWGELDGSSASCRGSSHRDWVWSLAQSLWPLPVSSIFLGREEGQDGHGKTERGSSLPTASPVPALQLQHQGQDKQGLWDSSQASAWAAHPVTWSAPPRHSKDLGNAAAFPGELCKQYLTAYIWGFRHLQNLHWLG